MDFKIGQRVKARKHLVDDVPGHTLTNFAQGEMGYISGVVTYERGGPMNFLVTPLRDPTSDWFEYPAPDFWKNFQVLR